MSLAMCDYGVWGLMAANIVQPFCLLIWALPVTKLLMSPFVGVQGYRALLYVAASAVLNNVIRYHAENLLAKEKRS
jgi:hypothetical protein